MTKLILARPCNIARMAKFFIQANTKCKISNSEILIYGEVSKELAIKVCHNSDIIGINHEPEHTDVYDEQDDEPEYESNYESNIDSKYESNIDSKYESNIDSKYESDIDSNIDSNNEDDTDNLLYPEVHRGEVYICNFGEPTGNQIAYTRYAIVVNDSLKDDMTCLVIPCTTKLKNYNRDEYHFKFTASNTVNFKNSHFSQQENIALVKQMQRVKKSQLTNIRGQLTATFMDKKLQPRINAELGIVEKPTPAVINLPNTNIIITKKMTNLLIGKNISEIMEIAQNNNGLRAKISEILRIFGFVIEEATDLLTDMIEEAFLSDTDYTITHLTKRVAEQNSDKKLNCKEIELKVVTSIKETFNVSKSPAIDLIRLICMFLKEGNKNENTD